MRTRNGRQARSLSAIATRRRARADAAAVRAFLQTAPEMLKTPEVLSTLETLLLCACAYEKDDVHGEGERLTALAGAAIDFSRALERSIDPAYRKTPS